MGGGKEGGREGEEKQVEYMYVSVIQGSEKEGRGGGGGGEGKREEDGE